MFCNEILVGLFGESNAFGIVFCVSFCGVFAENSVRWIVICQNCMSMAELNTLAASTVIMMWPVALSISMTRITPDKLKETGK